jgi:hypothetical protein
VRLPNEVHWQGFVVKVLAKTKLYRNFRDLLRIEGVRSVFFGEDFVNLLIILTKNNLSFLAKVSVQKRSEDEEWPLIKPLIFAAIMDHLQSGRPVINEGNGTAGVETRPTDTSDLGDL